MQSENPQFPQQPNRKKIKTKEDYKKDKGATRTHQIWLIRFIASTNGHDFPRLIVRLKFLLRNLILAATTETLLFENLTLLHIVIEPRIVNHMRNWKRKRRISIRIRIDILTLGFGFLSVFLAAVAMTVVMVTVLVTLGGPLGLFIRGGGTTVLATGVLGFAGH